jgi:hypothetical protein
MATYKLCADHVFPGSVFVPAGTIVSDLPGGVLPPAFPPTPYMDALDADAVTQMAAAGVQLIGSCVRMSSVPVCRWVTDPNAGPGNPYRQYVISGPLGVGQMMQQLIGTRGSYP